MDVERVKFSKFWGVYLHKTSLSFFVSQFHVFMHWHAIFLYLFWFMDHGKVPNLIHTLARTSPHPILVTKYKIYKIYLSISQKTC